MPGLLRGVARTAVVAGTATAVSNRVSRRQGARWAAEEQREYAAPAYEPQGPAYVASGAPMSDTDRISALRDLADLKAQGVLTEAEFEAEKARLLARDR